MYDPRNPATIFDGETLWQFALGLNNAHAIRLGLPSGNLSRPDLRLCMKAITDANNELEATNG
jgi:hypothetical protein